MLLAPSANAMRNMIAICDLFAKEYHVTFNCNKTKCITFTRPVESKAVRPLFVIDGKSVENVDEWSQLGHLINVNFSDNNDIQSRTNCLIGQVNNLLCFFSELDALVKNKLYKAFCTSFYGSVLWNLGSSLIERVNIAWGKGLRGVWSLLPDTSCDYTVYFI